MLVAEAQEESLEFVLFFFAKGFPPTIDNERLFLTAADIFQTRREQH